jgi:Asp-tRNA(Asn)/Glu-tRNA(Gln) amidotransferase C subunit
MAKEWEKFQSDYKKIKPAIDKHTAAAVSAVYKRVTLADANMSEGEANLAESTVTARANGVTGTSLPDFMKDKTFSDAKKLLDKAVGQFVGELKALDDFCDQAEKAADQVAALYKAIEKDLKSRKDKSESKKDIEALQATCLTVHGELEKVAAFKKKPNKYQRDYVANYMKTIDKILKEAPEEQVRKKDATELPQLFVDRNIKLNASKAMALAKKVGDDCNKALEASQADLKAALPHLKTAQLALVQLKKLSDDYAEAEKKFKAALIHKGLDTAARAFKGVSTTIKKAG